ncbi:ATP-binding protein [Legionella pneumophila serogroup 1]|nr:ATP-binding protein [Legionella pneumophila]HBD7114591.1 putative DNA binding domain-containing protein [Legionella pneumophila]
MDSYFLEKLMDLTIDPITKRIKNRESEHREFKIIFNPSHLYQYVKTIVSFANRDGGVLFFGIKDHPRELIGIDNKDVPTDLTFANFLKEYFEPELPFEIQMKTIHEKNICIVSVCPSIKKPIICKKEKKIKGEKGTPDEVLLRTGAIYYRYSSSTEEIKHAELRYLLDEQVKKIFHSLIDNVTILQKVGYDKAAIVDATELNGNNKTASVYLSNNTAKNMNWIKQGHFVENPSDGNDAFYVVRQVEIKHGIEIEKPTDYNKTHPLTKSALMKEVKVNSSCLDAVLWKLGIDNPKFHVSFPHGKNMLHKFSIEASKKILEAYPLNLSETTRRERFKEIKEEHYIFLTKEAKSSRS